MKQAEVADAAGMSESSIQRLETGRRDWTHGSVLLQSFYERRGILFVRPANGNGWGLIDNSETAQADQTSTES
jgi:transcriptional regulator with XRE-family HTH domain